MEAKNNFINRANGITTLMIKEDSELPENMHEYKGKRINYIFIHKNNKFIEEYKILLKPNITDCGIEFGHIYTYE